MPTIAITMPTVPTPKDHFTALVIRDTLEMELSVKVKPKVENWDTRQGYCSEIVPLRSFHLVNARFLVLTSVSLIFTHLFSFVTKKKVSLILVIVGSVLCLPQKNLFCKSHIVFIVLKVFTNYKNSNINRAISFFLEMWMSVSLIEYQKDTIILLTTATLMPTVPTPKDHSIVRVLVAIPVMESRVWVSWTLCIGVADRSSFFLPFTSFHSFNLTKKCRR